MESLHKKDTWALVTLPKNKNVIYCKWALKRKADTLGIKEARYKARLVIED